MSAFGSRRPGAGGGVGAAFADDAAFVAPALFAAAFMGEDFVGEVFAGAAFTAGLAGLLAVVAAFAAGAVLAGFAPALAVAALAAALPCPSAAAGFETALADTFTGAFDAFATRSSLAILVRASLGRLCRARLQMIETSSAAASLTIYVLPLSAAVQVLPLRQGAERFAAENLPRRLHLERYLSASEAG
ncbi:hypothetical protein MesoLj113c_01270 [Mesorhizobium sp. 113-3-9]|nr:hypothetical protein MesoLj113c_01270 [Mesorhizobium sp. 113-3-9]